jgi:catechol 2,3-dioxygenase-like lactoylglutathione lyase family enzyme
MFITHIDHVGLNVTDLQRSADWYCRVFGFEIIHKWTTTWMVGRALMRLGLFQRPGAKPVADLDNTIAMTHLAFQMGPQEFAAVQQELTRLGVPFDPPEDTGIAYSVFVSDPDGHQVEVTTYHA